MRTPLTVQHLHKLAAGWPGQYFSLHELLFSENALQAGLDNLPTAEEFALLKQFVINCLNPLRARWGGPLIITSGFRDPQVDALADNIKNASDHCCVRGAAADLRPAIQDERAVRSLYRMIADSSVPFDQLILYPTRLHVGWRPDGNRRELRRAEAGRYPLVTTEELALMERR